MAEARKKMNRSIADRILPIDPKKAALAAWPIFGGTTPGTPTPSATPAATDPPATTPTEPAAGGVATPDPLERLKNDPNALTQLLSQVQSLTNQVTQLTTENTSYKEKQTAEERSKLAKEQQLEQDLANERLRTEKAVNLLTQKTLENALLTHKEYQWHDSASALAKVDQNAIKTTIDIEKGVATVEGLENEIKRVARENSWMLSKGPATDPPKTGDQPNPAAPVAGRPTGTPPPPPNATADKAKQRNSMIDKYPVIAHGAR
jgi:hypothetical protein